MSQQGSADTCPGKAQGSLILNAGLGAPALPRALKNRCVSEKCNPFAQVSQNPQQSFCEVVFIVTFILVNVCLIIFKHLMCAHKQEENKKNNLPPRRKHLINYKMFYTMNSASDY